MANYTWNVGSGSLGTAGNWINTTANQSPSTTVPGAADTANFGTGSGSLSGSGSYSTLNFNGSTAGQAWVDAGSIAASNINIGDSYNPSLGTTATTNVIGGTLTLGSGFLGVGVGTNATGTLNIGSGGTVTTSQASQNLNYILDIGGFSTSTGSTGTVNVSGTGLLDLNGNPAAIGIGAGDTGTLAISGGGTARFGTLGPASSGTTAGLSIARAGTGTVTVDGAASSLTVSGGLYAGRATGSSGQVLLTNGATLTELSVGGSTNNSFGNEGLTNGVASTGGKGVLGISGGSKASFADALDIGSNGATGQATVTGTGSSLAVAAPITVGGGSLTQYSGGSGTLSVLAGATVKVTAAADTSQNYVSIGNSTASSGSVTVDGAGSLLDVGANAISVANGVGGTGTLTISNGATVRSASSDSTTRAALSVANATASTGTVTVTGAGSSLVAAGFAYIGRGGAGYLAVDKGGSFTGGSAPTGNGLGANAGFATVIGDGTPASGTNGIYYQGRGTATVSNGSTLHSLNALLIGNRGGTGTLNVSGAGSVAEADSTIAVGTGTERPGGTGTITISGGGTVRSGGQHTLNTADIAIGQQAGTTGTVTVTGVGSLLDANTDRLTVGSRGNGTLTVSGGAHALSGANYADTEAALAVGGSGTSTDTPTGTVTITGASSQLVASGQAVLGGNNTGAGVVQGGTGIVSVTSGGLLRATQLTMFGASSLTVDSASTAVIGSSAGTTGTLTVDSGSSVVGAGTIGATVVDNGSITAQGGVLTVGALAASSKGNLVVNGAELDIGTYTGEALTYTGGTTGTIRLSSETIGGAVSGFVAGDVFDFVGQTGLSLSGSTVTTSGGAAFNIAGVAQGTTIGLVADGTGGTELLAATQVPVGSAASTLEPAGTLSNAASTTLTAVLAALAGSSGVVNSTSLVGSSILPAIPGAANVAVSTAPAAGAVLALPSGYTALVANGGGAVTLSDSAAAGAVLVGNVAGDTFNASGASSTLIGGQGNNTFTITAGNDTVSTGDGTNTVTVSNASANITTGAGQDTVFLTGPASISLNGNATVVASGSAQVVGGTGTTVAFAGNGVLTYTGGSGADIVVGYNPGQQLFAAGGSGGGVYFANGGGQVTAGSGAQAVLVGANGASLFSAGAAGDLFGVDGPGDVSMDGSASTGNDVFFGAAGQGNSTYICGSGADLLGMGQGTNYVALGSGHDVVFGNPGTLGASFIVAGSGSADIGLGGATNTFYVGTAAAARSFNLFNFAVGADTLVLNGLPSSAIGAAIAGQTITNQSDVLTVGNTTVTLIGVTAPVTAAFFGPQAAPPTFPIPPGLLG